MKPQRKHVVDEIFELLKQSENITYAEAVSQLAHALQSAKLAVDAGNDEQTVIAALLHDIGHLCENEGDAIETAHDDLHETVGADYLRGRGFSEKVAQLVEGHVQAKRYLTFKNPEYMAKLSSVSKHTLQLQGGPFSGEQAEAFESDPLFEEKLRLRAWDEAAKKPELRVPDLETYRDMMLRHLGGAKID
jgi:2-amino-1-hydroxyethylphosphonate dioxygenase (glycine-forming)